MQNNKYGCQFVNIVAAIVFPCSDQVRHLGFLLTPSCKFHSTTKYFYNEAHTSLFSSRYKLLSNLSVNINWNCLILWFGNLYCLEQRYGELVWYLPINPIHFSHGICKSVRRSWRNYIRKCAKKSWVQKWECQYLWSKTWTW